MRPPLRLDCSDSHLISREATKRTPCIGDVPGNGNETPPGFNARDSFGSFSVITFRPFRRPSHPRHFRLYQVFGLVNGSKPQGDLQVFFRRFSGSLAALAHLPWSAGSVDSRDKRGTCHGSDTSCRIVLISCKASFWCGSCLSFQ